MTNWMIVTGVVKVETTQLVGRGVHWADATDSARLLGHTESEETRYEESRRKPIMPSQEGGASCAAPSVNFELLESGGNHRHECHVLRRICIFNGSLTPYGDGEHAAHAQRVAQSLIVRSQFGSHQTFPFARLHPMHVTSNGRPASDLLKMAPTPGLGTLSSCVPLVWVPTWAFSFADSWISSLVPIDELQSAGLIDDRVLLRPDLWAWPRRKNPVYEQIGALSAEPIRSVREVAPLCSEATAQRAITQATADRRQPGKLRQCIPHCYERLLLCQFKSTFDSYATPMSPWRAARRVAASVLGEQAVDAASPDDSVETSAADGAEAVANPRPRRHVLHVLFVNRTRTKFPRSIANLPQLLQRCAQAKAREWPAGWRVECAAHEFGAGPLRSDVLAARRAHVLVGTHGAGLVNAFFMRRGSVLVEARPYRFEGLWPDRYFRSLTSLEQTIFYLQISAGSASLSIPRPADDVTVWDARDHAVHVPWRSLKDALQAAIHINGSHNRYLEWLWTKGATFVSQAPKRLQEQPQTAMPKR